MDEQHEEARRRMRGGNSVMEHFVSGLKGLGFGVLGGVTSVVKQSYEGASNDGMQVRSRKKGEVMFEHCSGYCVNTIAVPLTGL